MSPATDHPAAVRISELSEAISLRWLLAAVVLINLVVGAIGIQSLTHARQRTIEQVKMHFRPDLKILGYLPTLCEEQRAEAQEILAELQQRFKKDLLPPIHKASDLAYAHSSHMDVFTYRPPRSRKAENIASSSRATHEYADLVEMVLKKTQPK